MRLTPTLRRRALSLLLLLGVATPAVMGTAACATRPAANVMLLYYDAGSLENKEFAECVLPGTSGSYPIDDETYTILTDVRTWNIAPTGGDSNTAIESGTKPGDKNQPGPKVKTWASADFVINRDCSGGAGSPVVKFWETLGRRYHISIDDDENGWDNAGWTNLLQNTLVVAERKAIAEGTRFYSADELDSNVDGVRIELERRIALLFQQELRAKLGGDFFCGVGFQTDAKGKPVAVAYEEYVQDGVDPATGRLKFKVEQRTSTCPPVRISITDVDFADPKIAEARSDVYAAEQRAKATLAAAQAELEKSNLLGKAASNQAYLRLKQVEAQLAAAEACKTNPTCTVIIDGSGNAGVNVGTGR